MLAWIGEKPCHLTAKCLKLSESIEDVAVQIMSEEQSFQRLAVLFHLLVMLIGNPKILMQLPINIIYIQLVTAMKTCCSRPTVH